MIDKMLLCFRTSPRDHLLSSYQAALQTLRASAREAITKEGEKMRLEGLG